MSKLYDPDNKVEITYKSSFPTGKIVSVHIENNDKSFGNRITLNKKDAEYVLSALKGLLLTKPSKEQKGTK